MGAFMRAMILSVLALVTLAACGNTERSLRDMRTTDGGPDEFSVIPAQPLALPETLALVTPTPGGANLADPTPKADAIAALGGNRAVQLAGGIPASDSGLIAQVTRYGVDADIRANLAERDATARRRKQASNVFNPLNRDRYFPLYAGQALDADAELARLAALGVLVPNAPAAE
ncbi:DUF3035 domain-containing protein [Loktanella sp. D2R18]|nr:DUF3035 domain-containing protein [Loktanella sp. D2R18]